MTARLPTPTNDAAAGYLAGQLFIIGGEPALGGPTATVWTWHPGDSGPRRLASLPAPLDKAAAFAWQGTLYVVGGLSGPSPLSARRAVWRLQLH